MNNKGFTYKCKIRWFDHNWRPWKQHPSPHSRHTYNIVYTCVLWLWFTFVLNSTFLTILWKWLLSFKWMSQLLWEDAYHFLTQYHKGSMRIDTGFYAVLNVLSFLLRAFICISFPHFSYSGIVYSSPVEMVSDKSKLYFWRQFLNIFLLEIITV